MARPMKPTFGITRLPPGQNKTRPDLRDDELIGLLESKGTRLAWSRAAICPCAPVNKQTRQPNPTCPKCFGGGVFYFGPADYAPPREALVLDEVQQAILTKDGAAVIRGVIQRVTQAQDFYDQFGNWVRGTMAVTVRPENRLGYYDRLVSLDSQIPYSQLVIAGPATAPVPLRYLATGVNVVETVDDRFEQDQDFDLVLGQIVWRSGRAPMQGARLSVHYLMHPTWLVIDHPHIIREIQRQNDGKPKITPLGNPTALPIQASVRFEFLPPRELPPSPGATIA